MEFLKIGIVLLTSLVLLGCGSQTLNDEGMDSKTIDEAASTSGASDSSFTVLSTFPANGATVSTSPQISLNFSDYLGSYAAGTSTTCSEQLFQLSTDNFTTCIGWIGPSFYSVSGKTITLNTPTLSANSYQLKVVPLASSGSISLTSSGGTSVTTTTVTFTIQ
jgi:hypothetical protein